MKCSNKKCVNWTKRDKSGCIIKSEQEVKICPDCVYITPKLVVKYICAKI